MRYPLLCFSLIILSKITVPQICYSYDLLAIYMRIMQRDEYISRNKKTLCRDDRAHTVSKEEEFMSMNYILHIFKWVNSSLPQIPPHTFPLTMPQGEFKYYITIFYLFLTIPPPFSLNYHFWAPAPQTFILFYYSHITF